MTFSAFDVIGPAMIGPSSSHTAGAVRIGLVRTLKETSEGGLAMTTSGLKFRAP